MPRFKPLPLAERINLAKIRRERGVIIAPPIPPSKSVQVSYRKDMNELITAMLKDIAANVIPLLITNQKAFVADASFSMQLRDIMNAVRRKYRDLGPIATGMATTAVMGEAKSNVERFNRGVERITGGVKLGRIVSEENLAGVLQNQIANNVELIQSIPDEYFKKISNAIYQGVSSGSKVTSLTEEIRNITGVTRSRAKLIARDQTQKTNSLITEKRQIDLGVESYIWTTSNDSRVRHDHAIKNGREFRWDDPPKDTGHPGTDIQCRCVARAVIKI